MTPEDAKVQIERCEAQRRRAILQRDWDALRSLLADDLVHVHARGGRVDDKESYLSQARNLNVLSMERGEMKIRLYGSVAVSVGTLTNVFGERGGELITMRAICTQVWDRSSGEWRLCSFQATAIA